MQDVDASLRWIKTNSIVLPPFMGPMLRLTEASSQDIAGNVDRAMRVDLEIVSKNLCLLLSFRDACCYIRKKSIPETWAQHGTLINHIGQEHALRERTLNRNKTFTRFEVRVQEI